MCHRSLSVLSSPVPSPLVPTSIEIDYTLHFCRSQAVYVAVKAEHSALQGLPLVRREFTRSLYALGDLQLELTHDHECLEIKEVLPQILMTGDMDVQYICSVVLPAIR